MVFNPNLGPIPQVSDEENEKNKATKLSNEVLAYDGCTVSTFPAFIHALSEVGHGYSGLAVEKKSGDDIQNRDLDVAVLMGQASSMDTVNFMFRKLDSVTLPSPLNDVTSSRKEAILDAWVGVSTQIQKQKNEITEKIQTLRSEKEKEARSLGVSALQEYKRGEGSIYNSFVEQSEPLYKTAFIQLSSLLSDLDSGLKNVSAIKKW